MIISDTFQDTYCGRIEALISVVSHTNLFFEIPQVFVLVIISKPDAFFGLEFELISSVLTSFGVTSGIVSS